MRLSPWSSVICVEKRTPQPPKFHACPAVFARVARTSAWQTLKLHINSILQVQESCPAASSGFSESLVLVLVAALEMLLGFGCILPQDALGIALHNHSVDVDGLSAKACQSPDRSCRNKKLNLHGVIAFAVYRLRCLMDCHKYRTVRFLIDLNTIKQIVMRSCMECRRRQLEMSSDTSIKN